MSTNTYKQNGELTVNTTPAQDQVKTLETAQHAKNELVSQQIQNPAQTPTAAKGQAATCRMV
jgi:hypothetical protein